MNATQISTYNVHTVGLELEIATLKTEHIRFHALLVARDALPSLGLGLEDSYSTLIAINNELVKLTGQNSDYYHVYDEATEARVDKLESKLALLRD